MKSLTESIQESLTFEAKVEIHPDVDKTNKYDVYVWTPVDGCEEAVMYLTNEQFQEVKEIEYSLGKIEVHRNTEAWLEKVRKNKDLRLTIRVVDGSKGYGKNGQFWLATGSPVSVKNTKENYDGEYTVEEFIRYAKKINA